MSQVVAVVGDGREFYQFLRVRRVINHEQDIPCPHVLGRGCRGSERCGTPPQSAPDHLHLAATCELQFIVFCVRKKEEILGV